MKRKTTMQTFHSARRMSHKSICLSLLICLSFTTITVDAGLQNNNGLTTCPLLHMFPFSNYRDQTIEQAQLTAQTGFSYLAAAELAIRHFNNRNTAVVPELADPEFENCHVELSTLAAVDSRGDKLAGVQELLREMDHQRETQKWPCAILGPDDPGGVELSGSIATAYDIWHISYLFARPRKPGAGPGPKKEEEDDSSSKEEGRRPPPSAGLAGSPPKSFLPSLMPHAEEGNSLILQYLLDLSHGNNRYLSVLLENAPEFLKQADKISQAGADLGINIKLFPQPDIYDKLKAAKQSGYRTIYTLLRSHQFNELAQVAEELGMLESDDYLFVLNPKAVSIAEISRTIGEQPAGSPIDKLLKGALMMDFVDGFTIWGEKEDKFLQAWREQDASVVQELNAALPESATQHFKGMPDDYFQTQMPAQQTSFVYDSVISTGMAACRVGAKATDEPTSQPSPRSDKSPPPGTEDKPGPNRLRNLSPIDEKQGSSGEKGPPPPPRKGPKVNPFQKGMLETKFQGASGHVAFVKDDEACSSPAYFGAFNVRAKFNPETGKHSYEAVLISHTMTSLENQGFVHVPGESFVYRSGSMERSADYRQYNEQNYISTGVRIFGLMVMTLCWLLALVAATFVIIYRNQPMIQLGQPVFLVLLCLGSIVLAASIYTLSWDEGAGWTQDQLDIACALTPWLFFIGHVVNFSAIFCKLWRLDKVLQVQRRKVGAAQSIGPLFLFLAVTISILSIWTVVDPWQWEREVINDLNAESYGKCTNSNWWAFFAPLMFCVVISEAIAAYFAIKTNDAPDGLSESSSVFYTICVQLQAWALGVPILAVIGTSSADTTYVGRVILIGFFSISSVMFMVGSKVWRAMEVKRRGSTTSIGRGSRVHISGLNSPGYEQPSSSQFTPIRIRRVTGSSLTHEVMGEGSEDLERGKVDQTCVLEIDPSAEDQATKKTHPDPDLANDVGTDMALDDVHPLAHHQSAPGTKLPLVDDSDCSDEFFSMAEHAEEKPQPPTSRISEEAAVHNSDSNPMNSTGSAIHDDYVDDDEFVDGEVNKRDDSHKSEANDATETTPTINSSCVSSSENAGLAVAAKREDEEPSQLASGQLLGNASNNLPIHDT